MRIGAHVSIEEKIYLAVDRAKTLGCDTMQIFPGNPRSWYPLQVSSEDAQEFQRRRAEAKISPVAIHLPYLINLGSARLDTQSASVASMKAILGLATMLGADYLVVHVGSHGGQGREKGLIAVARNLRRVLEESVFRKKILLENTAGAGYALGYRMKDLGEIFAFLDDDERVGFCLDTSHAFAAGYDLSQKEGLKLLLEEIEQEFGLKRLLLVHANDARGTLGSGRDRHEHIGKGHIGLEGFKILLSHPYLSRLPFIIETPRMGSADDARNIELLRSLAGRKG